MLGAILMVCGIGLLVYVIVVCVCISGLGGGASIGTLIFMACCVVGVVALLYFASEIVNMKINISF
ncbi:MAG: hypothetical protein ACRCX7_10025 [Cetobacterium sp.]|uniref:hypothetical protein n=1 Tax=Cetobacterium sp. TaxID=2071632 RepID=UPI003F418325